MLHTHIDFRPSPRVTNFEEALPLADHALDFPPGTLLAMLLDASGDVTDTLCFTDGDRCPIEVVEFVCRYANSDDCSLLIATNRAGCDPRDREFGDVELWDVLAQTAEDRGLRLLDYFVLVGDLLFVPREIATGEDAW